MSHLDYEALTRHLLNFPITTFLTIPSVINHFNSCNDTDSIEGLSSLKEIFSAAAPMSKSLQSAIRRKLDTARHENDLKLGTALCSQWGMTEISGAVDIPFS